VSRPLLVALLPVRNGAKDLPGWFASVERFCDAVVALDDGSTDATGEMLGRHPLVRRVLRNPRRESYEGWDDAENRQRLIDAAGELNPRWLLFLDGDERIDAGDAAALRGFLEGGEAREECGYGFEVFRMAEDEEHHDPDGLWVYRLFAARAGLEMPSKRLHFVPIPRDIPRRLVLRTSIRIQHLGSLDQERREARRAKYAEADPGDEFQEGYDHILDAPGRVERWRHREPGVAVLLPVHRGSASGEGGPAISAVVIAQDDEATIERSLRAVIGQELDAAFEVIVVTSGSDRTVEIVRSRFCGRPGPEVRLVELDHRVLPGEARNTGWRIARGDFISFPGSHVELAPGSLAARLAAHEDGWAMVTGTTLNGNVTRAGWGSYFLDHSTLLPGRAGGELQSAPSHCSYVRFLLEQVGGFPEGMRAGEDTVVNLELFRRGYSAYREPAVAFTHASRATTAGELWRHHLVRGRAWGRILLGGRRSRWEVLLRSGPRLMLEAPRRVWAIRSNVGRWGTAQERGEFRRALPWVVLGAVAANVGTWRQIVGGSGSVRSES
jgi:glycosyltransferase involved in cell wall biosynthesis